MSFSIISLLPLLTIAIAIPPQKLSGVSIPPEYAYLLPLPFEGNITQNFIDTTSSNASLDTLFAAARNATYIAYDEDFYSILGPSPTIQLIEYKNETVPFAEEAGIWVPNHNQVWFTSDGSVLPTYFSILDLSTNTITTPNNTAQHGTYPNGGTYFNNLVYFTSLGNKSIHFPPGIYSIDSSSPSTPPIPILNSYFGVNLNSVDDLTWVSPNTSLGSTSCTHPNEPNLFFTTLDLNPAGETDLSVAVLPNAVYRFTPSTKFLRAVISRADVLVPNGIRVDPSGKYLYVTDSSPLTLLGAGAGSPPNGGSPAIYRFELDSTATPSIRSCSRCQGVGTRTGFMSMIMDAFGRRRGMGLWLGAPVGRSWVSSMLRCWWMRRCRLRILRLRGTSW